MSAGSSPRETLTMKLRISASLLYVTSIILIISCANIQSAVADDANAPCTTANDKPFGFCADTTPGGVNANAWKNAHKELPSSDPNVPPPTVNDRRATTTAEANPAASSQPFKRCVEVFVGKAANSPIVSDDATVVRCELPPGPEGGPNQDPGRVPTTRDILYMAATIIHADGAGLYKRPLNVSYTNKYIPSIVAVTSPTQTHVINLLGHDITIRSRPRVMSGVGVMELQTWSPRPRVRCGKRAWT